MQTLIHGERTLTELDFVRLRKLLGHQPSASLAELLDRADLMTSRTVAGNIVTMNSRVEVVDVNTRRRQTLTVCYPADARPADGFVSVLSPVGNSLLGRKVGEIASWHVPPGEQRAVEVAAIVFQPEAAGDYVT